MYQSAYCKFLAESAVKKILKIGQHLPKLCLRLDRHGFFDSHCTCMHSVHGSVCHFKFPKVVLAHILGEVGSLCINFLNVYSRTCMPIFIEMGSY